MIIYNQNIDTDCHIFITISDIESLFQEKNIVIIILNENVQFVNPLFLLLLIDLQYKYKKILIIDIISLDRGDEDSRQYIVHWTLSYYRSLSLLKEQAKYKRKKKISGESYIDHSVKNIEPLFKLNEKARENHYFDNSKNTKIYESQESKIFYYYSKTPRDNLALNEKDYFTFIPIIKLSNHYSEFNKETGTSFEKINAINDPSKYIDLPEGIQEIVEKTTLDIKGCFTRDSIEKIVKKVYDKNNNLNEVIYEIFDNIRQHTENTLDNRTKKIANAYMSFRHNKKDKKYELIVGDTFEKGFLESYGDTLQSELVKLRKQAEAFNRKLSKDFDDIYNRDIYRLDLENKTTEQLIQDEKNVLNALFNVDDASNSENAFSSHQLRRIIMHFGIPTLIRIINQYINHDFKASVDIFIHRSNRFYRVHYNGEKTIVEFLGNKGQKGTFYHISLDDEYIPTEETLSTNTQLGIDGLKKAFVDKTTIKSALEKFIDYEDATNKTDISSIKIDYKNFEQGKINYFDTDIKFNTIGSFLRNLYKYAFLRNTQDIMVVNFPLNKFSNYLYDLIRIIYPSKDQEYQQALNILFYDDKLPIVFFLGGKDIYELCLINVKASKLYNQKLPILIENIVDDDSDIKNFIEDYNLDDMAFDTPLVQKSGFITEAYSTKGLEQQIINTLNKKKNNIPKIHIDTRNNHHLDGFYLYENILLNSVTVDGISLWLSDNIRKHNKKDIVLIGTDKYAELVLAKTKSIFDDSYTISSFVLGDFKNASLKKFKSFYTSKSSSNTFFIIFSPVVFTGLRVNKYIIQELSHMTKDNIQWFTAIKVGKEIIEIDNKVISCEYIVNHNFKEKDKGFNSYKVSAETPCPVCTNYLEEEPLYKMNLDNSYKIDDYYSGVYEKKKFKSYVNMDEDDPIYVNWEKSIYFGHAIRGSNHFTYYIDTPMFLEENKNEIIEYLNEKRIVQKIFNYILIPQHDTNNDFATLVNKIVFDNKAIIIQIDNLDTEANLSKLDIGEHSRKNIGLYFLDDTIASGKTLEYFYILLKAKNKEFSFDGAFVLLDRMTVYDENVIEDYFVSSNEEELIYSFAQLEINPIKTAHDIKECFLCNRQKDYIKYLQESVLDTNRVQAAKRVVGLHAKDYRSLSSKDCYQDIKYQIKTFIKMKAVEFVYKKSITKTLNRKDSIIYYNNLEKEYIDSVTEELEKIYVKDDMFGTNFVTFKIILEKISEHEARIALLKALTFPKLVYYKNIRAMATYVIIHRIKQEKQKYTELKKFFPSGFSSKANKSFKELHKNLQEFLEPYKEKNQIDYLNFLYRVAGYLNITYILHKDNIEFFYNICAEEIRKKDREVIYEGEIKGTSLSSYPFAVKMVSSESDDKSIYLKKQLEKFYDSINYYENETYNSYFTLIHALELENNLIHKNKFEEKSLSCILEKSELSIEDKIDDLKNVVSDYIVNTRDQNKFKKKEIDTDIEKLDFSIENIYINENLNLEYVTYEEYLKGTILRDVLNNFHELVMPRDTHIDMLYKGAKAAKDTSLIKHIYQDKIHEINLTWANIYVNELKNEKLYTIVRLVDININKLKSKNSFKDKDKYNDTLWFRPIGCIVLSHDSDYKGHLEYSKLILAIQNNLVDFFKEEFSHETFKETILRSDLDLALTSYNHTTGSMFEVGSALSLQITKLSEKCNENPTYNVKKFEGFESLNNYFYGVSKISRIAQLFNKEDLKSNATPNIYDVLDSEINTIELFFKSADKLNMLSNNIKIEYEENLKSLIIPLKDEYLIILFFELFFNAAKYNNLKGEICKINISYKDNMLLISNNRIIGEQDKNIGLNSARFHISRLLNKVNFILLDPEESKNTYTVIIKQKEKEK